MRYMMMLNLVAVAVPATMHAQVTFLRTYGGEGRDQGNSVQQTTDGGYVIGGLTGSYGAGNDDVWLIKTDAVGDTMWAMTFGSDAWEGGWFAEQTTDAGYIVAGTGDSESGGDDLLLIKTDSAGGVVWSRRIDCADEDFCFAAQQTEDGGYIAAGYTDLHRDYDFWLVRTDPSGDTLWTRLCGGPENEQANSVEQTGDGGFAVVGYTRSFGKGGYDAWFIRTDVNGDTMWTRSFGGEDYDEAKCVVQTSDGGFAVAGYTRSLGKGGLDAWLVRTDANGDTLWTRTYGGEQNDIARSVLQTADGGFVLVGRTGTASSGGNDVWLIRTDPKGDTIWTRTYGSMEWDEALAVALAHAEDGGYVITGWAISPGRGDRDILVVKTDLLGRVAIEERPEEEGAGALDPTVLTRAQLLAELEREPGLSLFDATGRRIRAPVAGVLFLHSVAATRKVLLTR